MKISQALNLVQPIPMGESTYYVHSTPISNEVWENYALPIAQTFDTMTGKGLGVTSGPRTAKMLLKHFAQGNGSWSGDGGLENGLLAEVRRLSNVIMPTASGWSSIPFDAAAQSNMIDDASLREAEGFILFFICVSAMLDGPRAREKLTTLLDGLRILWGLQTTSLDSTAFAASLPSLTPAAISTPTQTVTSSLAY